jgi:hypothetical protein
MLLPIRDPEKDPTPKERDSLQANPSLYQALNALIPDEPLFPIDLNLEAGDAFINTQPMEEDVEIPSDDEGSEAEPNFTGIEEDSSNNNDVASFGSNDSIQRNADFVSFGYNDF